MKPDCEVLRKSDYEVRKVDLDVCQSMVKRFHYARGGSNTGTFCHGLFRRGDETPLGIAWWIPPTKGAAKATFPEGDWQQVISLSRLVVHPDIPQNAATFMLGKSMKMIGRDGRYPCLVTYADTWQGHDGTIYRASNWEDKGLTKPEAVWVDSEGRMVARKAGPKTRRKHEMEELGYRMLGRFAKRKFRKVLLTSKGTGYTPEDHDDHTD